MTSATITTQPDGTGEVQVGGQTHRITSGTIEGARSDAISIVTSYAQQLGQPVAATIHDAGQQFHISVTPEGRTVEAAPPIEVPTFAPAPAPAPVTTRPAAAAVTAHPVAPPPAPPATSPVPAPESVQAAPPVQRAATPPPPAPEQTAAPVTPGDAEWEQIQASPATQGVRGRVNTLFRAKIAPGADELTARRTQLDERRRAEQAAAREAEEHAAGQQRHAVQESRRAARQREREARDVAQRRTIQFNFGGTRTILVANPKGGARKTTTTYLLAATMGRVRGGSVIAWDANETMGTLGQRSIPDPHNRTVVDLLEEAAPKFTSLDTARFGLLDPYLRPQGDSHFDVLASDEDPTRQDMVDADGFATVHDMLSRFYRMILIDTGNNIRASHFRAALDSADQLIIPVAASHDSKSVALGMMRSLAANGHEDLVSSAIVLIHDLEPVGRNDDGDVIDNTAYFETAQQIAAEFEGHVAAVLPIPFDSALKHGGVIDYDQLSSHTRTAYLEAAAAAAQSISQHGADQ